MRTMKRMLVAGMLAAGLVSSVVHAAAPSEIARFTANGEFARNTFYDAPNDAYGSVAVYRTGTASSPSASLFFDYFTCDCLSPTCSIANCSGIYGGGPIPSRDFSASPERASVSTDTTINPNFVVYRFEFNTYSGDWFEEEIPLRGSIAFSWIKSGTWSFETQGTWRSKTLRVTSTQVGRQTYGHASSSGSVFGYSNLSTEEAGQMGTQIGTTVTITRD